MQVGNIQQESSTCTSTKGARVRSTSQAYSDADPGLVCPTVAAAVAAAAAAAAIVAVVVDAATSAASRCSAAHDSK